MLTIESIPKKEIDVGHIAREELDCVAFLETGAAISFRLVLV